jgi:hypothetical protein
MFRPTARPFPALAAAVFAAAILPSVAPLGAISTCQSGSCTACAPSIPGTVSSYIGNGEFPDGAEVPIVFVDPDDGLHHRFVATQEGAILAWDTLTQSFLATPFLDLRFDNDGPGLDKVNYDGGERGLLSVAFDPDYAETGRFWVYYTSRSQSAPTIPNGAIVVEGYQRSTGDPNVASTTRTLLFHITHGATNHNGGHLAFGPDGYLYVSTGDGGGGCDSNQGINGDGQQPDTLLGKILRIDVRGIAPSPAAPECGLNGANYTVPNDNPFVGQPDSCNEVWTLGLRNPFRFSFDRLTGDLYVGDVGQDNYEEFNLRPATATGAVNFGWVCREGCDSSSTGASSCSIAGCPVDPGATCAYPARPSGFIDPILCHSNPGGWSSAMGGYRYRGSFVPSLDARYLYTDAGAGQIWVTTSLDPSNPGATASCCWDTGNGGTYGFAEDRLGELYVVNGGAGRIDCIANGAGCFWANWAGFFEDGFETGDTTRWSSVVP